MARAGIVSEGFGRFWLDGLKQDLSKTHPISDRNNGDRWLLGWMLAAVLVFLAGYLAGGHHVGFAGINALAVRLPESVWQWLTVLGDGRLVVILSLLVARKRPDIFWAMVLTALLGLALTHGLKPLFKALRPASVLDADSFYIIGHALYYRSFPSGHSLTIAAFLGVWIWFLRGWRIRLLLIALACTIALSRVIVGAHWPLDVVAGIAGGTLAAWLGCRLSQRIGAGLSVWGHAGGIILCLLASYSLFYDDGGYPKAALLQQGAILVVYGYILHAYLLQPYRAWRQPGNQTPAILWYWDVLLCVFLQMLFVAWPEIDLQVSGWFFHNSEGFYLANNPLVQFSYRLFADLHFLVLPLLLGVLLWRLFCKYSGKAYLYLLLVLIIGPGLVVNGILKEHSGRARPHAVEEFGGERHFSGAFVKSDQCEKNCSFVSGHASMGFFFLALGWVMSSRVWLSAGIILGCLVGLGRMIQGAHFFSDVIFSFWVVYFTALLLARLFYPDKRLQRVVD